MLEAFMSFLPSQQLISMKSFVFILGFFLNFSNHFFYLFLTYFITFVNINFFSMQIWIPLASPLYNQHLHFYLLEITIFYLHIGAASVVCQKWRPQTGCISLSPSIRYDSSVTRNSTSFIGLLGLVVPKGSLALPTRATTAGPH